MARGHPDALVAGPRPDTFETSVTGVTRPLLAVIEAKGHGGTSVGVRAGITQAHRHLAEVTRTILFVDEGERLLTSTRV